MVSTLTNYDMYTFFASIFKQFNWKSLINELKVQTIRCSG